MNNNSTDGHWMYYLTKSQLIRNTRIKLQK